MEAGSLTASGGRSALERSSRSRAADPLLRWVLTGLAALVLILIAFFFVRLFIEAKPAFDKFGYFGFVFDNNWDCLLYTSPSPRDGLLSRMPSSA